MFWMDASVHQERIHKVNAPLPSENKLQSGGADCHMISKPSLWKNNMLDTVHE